MGCTLDASFPVKSEQRFAALCAGHPSPVLRDTQLQRWVYVAIGCCEESSQTHNETLHRRSSRHWIVSAANIWNHEFNDPFRFMCVRNCKIKMMWSPVTEAEPSSPTDVVSVADSEEVPVLDVPTEVVEEVSPSGPGVGGSQVPCLSGPLPLWRVPVALPAPPALPHASPRMQVASESDAEDCVSCMRHGML